MVVGSQDADLPLLACLESLVPQAEPLGAEVLVAGSLGDETRRVIERRFPRVHVLAAGPDLLVPELWELGLRWAAAPIVALTTAQCRPAADWLTSAAQALEDAPEASAVGGPIEPPQGGSAADWAVYFARYAAYMPPVPDGPVAEIPGDNAVYRKKDLDLYWQEGSGGFWETLVHRRMRSAGRSLRMSPTMGVCLVPGQRPGPFVRARFRHGRHFAATRPGDPRWRRFLRLFLSPLLPGLLLARVGRRVVSHRPDWSPRYLAALPWLAIFFASWSLGEAAGYISGRPR